MKGPQNPACTETTFIFTNVTCFLPRRNSCKKGKDTCPINGLQDSCAVLEHHSINNLCRVFLLENTLKISASRLQ